MVRLVQWLILATPLPRRGAGAYIVGVVNHPYLATRLPLWLTLSSYASTTPAVLAIEDNAEVGKVSSEEERSFFEEKLSEVRLVIYFTKSLVTWCFAFVLPSGEAPYQASFFLCSRTSILSTPIFTSEEVYQKVTKLQDKVATVNRIPKPKPKIEKPPKEEPVSQENSTGTSNNTSGEPMSETGQTTQDSVDSSHTGTDQERAVHDEL
ncbi:hypothetical protein BHE74_00035298 [Ensete ventricosum]|nr:hypothetical protein BHE74_00035298 [Ensete ventricosum]